MRQSKRLSSVVLVLALGLLAASCRGPGADSVATVNGVDIPRELLERVIATQVSESATENDSPIPQLEQSTAIANTERTFLTLFIRVEIVRQLADDLGVLVSEEDIDQRWEFDVAARAGGEQELIDFIESLGLTVEEYRDFELANAARIEGIEEAVGSGVEITDQMIADEYAAREWEEARASHILVETEAEAIDLKQQLDDGADFGELAEQHSQDPGSAALGGDLGVQGRGTYVPEFEEYIWSAELDVISDPVQTDFGWHLIVVTERRNLSLEEAEEGLRTELESRERSLATQDRFTEAIENADVVVDSRIGVWDAELAEVVSGDSLDQPGGGTIDIPEVVPSP